jgi:hypothetical protein
MYPIHWRIIAKPPDLMVIRKSVDDLVRNECREIGLEQDKGQHSVVGTMRVITYWYRSIVFIWYSFENAGSARRLKPIMCLSKGEWTNIDRCDNHTIATVRESFCRSSFISLISALMDLTSSFKGFRARSIAGVNHAGAIAVHC